jgi:excisionase family DNA binding protein
MADRLLYRPEEVSEMLSLGKSKIFQLLRTGEIASISCGRARRVPREALDSGFTSACKRPRSCIRLSQG